MIPDVPPTGGTNAPLSPPPAPAPSPAPAESGFSDAAGSSSIPADAAPEKEGKPMNAVMADIIESIISHIPETSEPVSATPEARAWHIVKRASTTAALISGGLAIPPGPLAFATVVPDLIAIWKIQSQMVADIAAAYGRKPELRREHMLYCLFRHVASQVARGVAVRVGQRVLIRPGTVALMNRLLSLVGRQITERIMARTATVWMPFVGAAAVGAYAWYDTRRVGRTAMELFAPAPLAASAAGPAPAEALGKPPAPSAEEQAYAEDVAGFMPDAPPSAPEP